MSRIDLQEPFVGLWRKAYLVTNKEPRRNVILFNSKTDRSTISYARYLMSVHLGRFLEKDEIVDHVNNDKMDDRIDNYQVITKRENNVKAIIQNEKQARYIRLSCGVCNTVFQRTRNRTHLVMKASSTYCSRVCAGKSSTGEFSPSLILEEFSINSFLPEDVKI